MRLFENRALSRLFERKRDDVTGGGRELPIEELHSLCFSPNITGKIKEIKKDGIDGECSTYGGDEKCSFELL